MSNCDDNKSTVDEYWMLKWWWSQRRGELVELLNARAVHRWMLDLVVQYHIFFT